MNVSHIICKDPASKKRINRCRWAASKKVTRKTNSRKQNMADKSITERKAAKTSEHN